MKSFKIFMEAFRIANSKSKDLKSRSSISYNLQRKRMKIKSKIKIDILTLIWLKNPWELSNKYE